MLNFLPETNLAVLRIRAVYPGSRFFPIPDPRSWVPDPGSNQKGGKIFFKNLFNFLPTKYLRTWCARPSCVRPSWGRPLWVLPSWVPPSWVPPSWVRPSWVWPSKYDLREYDLRKYDLREYDLHEYDLREYDLLPCEQKTFEEIGTELKNFNPPKNSF